MIHAYILRGKEFFEVSVYNRRSIQMIRIFVNERNVSFQTEVNMILYRYKCIYKDEDVDSK